MCFAYMSHELIKPTYVCAKQKHRPAWASIDSDQSRCWALSRYLRSQAFFMWIAHTGQTELQLRLILVFSRHIATLLFFHFVADIHTGKCIRRLAGIYAYCRYFIDRKW